MAEMLKRSVRVQNAQKVATLTFDDATIDRYIIKVTSDMQFEVWDNISSSLLYSRASVSQAVSDVAALNRIVTRDNDHEE